MERSRLRRNAWINWRCVRPPDPISWNGSSSLEYIDLELLQEHATLRETGFNEDQIVITMEDRHKHFQKAVARFQEGNETVLGAFRQDEETR
jgi:hypothetical protein